jgi:hypothetical protein
MLHGSLFDGLLGGLLGALRRRLPLRVASGVIAMGLTAHETLAQPAGTVSPAASVSSGPMSAASGPSRPANVFFSGHSLLAQPIPEFTQAIARSLGTPINWNQQSMGGSPIKWRSRGREDSAPLWSGYRQGDNRDGQNMDVIAELKTGASVGRPYDALVITEMAASLGTMLWNDTARYLRHYHERFQAGNPQGTTWFYESWFDLSDKNDPRRWIAYEREATVVWQCIAARVNASLALERRPDRIRSLPAGVALVHLVEQATQGAGVPGITLGNVRQTVDSLIYDDIHVTRLGSYYLALVIDATLFGRSPVGAWRPADIGALQANSLQSIAGAFAMEQAKRMPMPLDQCRAFILDGFIPRYWAYVRDAYMIKLSSLPKAYWDWARYLVEWQLRLRRRDASNPLHFDAATDRGYWLPAP